MLVWWLHGRYFVLKINNRACGKDPGTAFLGPQSRSGRVIRQVRPEARMALGHLIEKVPGDWYRYTAKAEVDVVHVPRRSASTKYWGRIVCSQLVT